MSQLIDNLNIIESVKTDIKSAIEAKGVDMTGISFPGYASKIGEISGGGGWDQKSFTEGVVKIINLDNTASFVASSAFKGNTNIHTVNLPYATSVGIDAFRNCFSLSQVSLPMCEFLGENAFYNCTPLTQMSLLMCSYIDSGAFYRCRSLNIITIGYSSICSLISSDAFNGTQITSSIGSIYVTASLVDSYKSASNWSYFSTQIFPIPE